MNAAADYSKTWAQLKHRVKPERVIVIKVDPIIDALIALAAISGYFALLDWVGA